MNRVRNRISPGALILLYHRVGEPEMDPQLLSVSRRNFDEQMQVLRKYRTASLESLLSARRTGRCCVAVTFDDGYADNLWNAKPLLENHAIPATMFVSAGYVLNRRPFWWDELQQLLLQADPLPETLSVTIGGMRREWFLGDSDTRRGTSSQDRGWNVLADSDPSQRYVVYRELCAAVRGLPPDERDAVLDELRSAIAATPDSRSEACTPEEIRRLHEPGLIEIGAHTCGHPVLSRLPVSEQQREISRSKELLEEMVGSAVNAFSYPFGTRSDYSAETVECVRRSGFRRACSNFQGRVRGSTDPYQLPRYLVRNWDGDSFARHLEKWTHA